MSLELTIYEDTKKMDAEGCVARGELANVLIAFPEQESITSTEGLRLRIRHNNLDVAIFPTATKDEEGQYVYDSWEIGDDGKSVSCMLELNTIQLNGVMQDFGDSGMLSCTAIVDYVSSDGRTLHATSPIRILNWDINSDIVDTDHEPIDILQWATDIESEIKDVNTLISETAESITGIRENIESFKNEVESSNEQLNNTINSLSEDVETNTTAISGIQTNVAEMSTQVGTNSNNISLLSSNLDTFSSNVSTSIANLQKDKANAAALQSEVDRAKAAEATIAANVNAELTKKVDKVEGKGLSTADYTNEEKTKLAGIEAGAQKNPDLSPYAKTEDVNLKLTKKVDKEDGKGLSSNDYTTEEKSKLSGIEKGAQVNPDLTPYAKTAEVNSKLTTKVDKEEGKGLSTEDFTTEDKGALVELYTNRFHISVDGLDVFPDPTNRIVNVITNYSIQEGVENGGVVSIYCNTINTIQDATGIHTIMTYPPVLQGVADYLLYIVVTEETNSITFSNGLGGKFLAPSDDVFALETGVNLLSFTQVTESDLAVNRVLLSEVS